MWLTSFKTHTSTQSLYSIDWSLAFCHLASFYGTYYWENICASSFCLHQHMLGNEAQNLQIVSLILTHNCKLHSTFIIFLPSVPNHESVRLHFAAQIQRTKMKTKYLTLNNCSPLLRLSGRIYECIKVT